MRRWQSVDIEAETIEPIIYDDDELWGIYRYSIDKEEYPTYSCWIWDLERSGILVRMEDEEDEK